MFWTLRMSDKGSQNNSCNISDISWFFPDDVRTHQKQRNESPSTSLTLGDTKDSSGVQATIIPSSIELLCPESASSYRIHSPWAIFICSWYLKNRRGSKTVTSVSERTGSGQRSTTLKRFRNWRQKTLNFFQSDRGARARRQKTTYTGNRYTNKTGRGHYITHLKHHVKSWYQSTSWWDIKLATFSESA